MKPRSENPLPAHDWEEVRALFDRCLESDELTRRRLLDDIPQEKAWLRQEVESLLVRSTKSDALMGPSLVEQVAPAPRKLGRYVLLQKLGAGGMAEVYLAKMTGPSGFGRLVAVKCILPGRASDGDFKRLFEYEASLSSQLNHPNITHLYDFGEYEGTYVIAMEYVDGINLNNIVEKRLAVPRDAALYAVSLVASALEHAHAKTVIHRDLSPKNLMVSFTGEVKVVDFGIAKAQGRATMTRTGLFRGTAAYLSPEAVDGREVDARSDLYSVCVVLYELLSGEPLFDGQDIFSVIREIRETDLTPRLETLSVDEGIRALLAKGLAKSPADRFQTANELRQALLACLDGKPADTLQASLASFLKAHFSETMRERRSLLASAEKISVNHQATLPMAGKKSRRWKVGAGLFAAAILIASLLGRYHRYRQLDPAVLNESVTLAEAACAQEAECSRIPGTVVDRAPCLLAQGASPSCRAAVLRMPCMQEMWEFCAGPPPQAVRCLKANPSRLSDRCRAGMATIFSRFQ